MVGTLAKSSVLRKVWVVEIVCHVKLRLAPWEPRRYLTVSASSRLIQFGQFFEGLSPLVLSSRLMGVWMKCFRLSLAKLSAMKPFSVCFPCCLVELEFCRFPLGGCALLCWGSGRTPTRTKRGTRPVSALLAPGVTLALQLWNAVV